MPANGAKLAKRTRSHRHVSTFLSSALLVQCSCIGSCQRRILSRFLLGWISARPPTWLADGKCGRGWVRARSTRRPADAHPFLVRQYRMAVRRMDLVLPGLCDQRGAVPSVTAFRCFSKSVPEGRTHRSLLPRSGWPAPRAVADPTRSDFRRDQPQMVWRKVVTSLPAPGGRRGDRGRPPRWECGWREAMRGR